MPSQGRGVRGGKGRTFPLSAASGHPAARPSDLGVEAGVGESHLAEESLRAQPLAGAASAPRVASCNGGCGGNIGGGGERQARPHPGVPFQAAPHTDQHPAATSCAWAHKIAVTVEILASPPPAASRRNAGRSSNADT